MHIWTDHDAFVGSFTIGSQKSLALKLKYLAMNFEFNTHSTHFWQLFAMFVSCWGPYMMYLHKMMAHDTPGHEVMLQTSYEQNMEGKLSMILHQFF